MAYFVPDDTLEKALADAAERGVVVRIILPSYSDFSGVFYAGRAHYDGLLESGVKLYELESAFLHSKSIVVDGVWSSIGSTNFDWRSFVHNNEISVCVIDEGFAHQMTDVFTPISPTRARSRARPGRSAASVSASKSGCGCRSSIGYDGNGDIPDLLQTGTGLVGRGSGRHMRMA